MAKFLLDSGDPEEYKVISQLAKEKGSELWGATTNPSLIAKKLAASGKKLTTQEAFALQKDIVLQIVEIVPGAVSGEVYSDQNTTAEEMAEQGRDIATWHPRVVVKLPTTLEGFKARTILRKENITINNTLVFSQEQVYAICLHEKLIQSEFHVSNPSWPPFISPFLGRLDDKGEDGIAYLEKAMKLKNTFFEPSLTWMLAASIRNSYHMKKAIELNCELMTVPAKTYQEWFGLTEQQKQSLTSPVSNLTPVAEWIPSDEIKNISSLDDFMNAISSEKLNITHPLTSSGIDKFVADWQAILAQ